MPDNETPQQRLKAVDSWLKTLTEEKAELERRVGGNGAAPDALHVKVEQERKDAELFDNLSPGQLTELYVKDRPRWEAIMKAKERQGLRKLMGR